MFFIPGWISNVLLLIACVLSGWRHSQLDRPNPVTNLRFGTMVLAILTMLAVTLYHPDNPWLSAAFLLIAVTCLGSTIHQQRMLPLNTRSG